MSSQQFLVLKKDQVCGQCNKGPLRSLDEYLQKQFGLLKVLWNSEGSKSGKPARVERPGLLAVRRPDGPCIGLNAGKKKVLEEDGSFIQPSMDREEAVRVDSFEAEGSDVRIRFKQPFRMNKRFMRGLFKIGLELLCLQEGIEFVLDSRFDLIREYVLRGKGSRQVFFCADVVDVAQPVSLVLHYVDEVHAWVAELSLGITFFVDLSPDNVLVLRADPGKMESSGLVCWSDQGGGQFAK